MSATFLPRTPRDGAGMTEREEDSKLAEVDRLLNDPSVPMRAARVWELLAEVSRPEDDRLDPA